MRKILRLVCQIFKIVSVTNFSTNFQSIISHKILPIFCSKETNIKRYIFSSQSSCCNFLFCENLLKGELNPLNVKKMKTNAISQNTGLFQLNCTNKPAHIDKRTKTNNDSDLKLRIFFVSYFLDFPLKQI